MAAQNLVLDKNEVVKDISTKKGLTICTPAELIQRFATTCQQAAVGVAHLSLQGNWLWVNPKLCEIVGYSQAELLNMTYIDLTFPDDVQPNLRLEEQLFNKEISIYAIEKRYLKKDGQIIWVKVTASLICNEAGGPDYRIAFIEDITLQKQIEQELQQLRSQLEEQVAQRTTELQHANQSLRETTERLNLALSSARMGTWYWNNIDNKVIWDEQIEALFGLEPGTFAGTYDAFLACIHPDDRERVKNEVGQTVVVDTCTQSEYRIILPDGSIRTIAARGKVFCDEQGNPIRTTGVCLDVTEHKKIEQTLHDLTERYYLALDSAQAGTWHRSLPDNETFWDKHIERLFGFEPDTFPGHYEAFLERIHPEDRERTIQKIEYYTHLKKGFELEYRVVWPDGSIHIIADRGKIFYDEQGKAISITGVCLDITERRQLEEEMQRHQHELANAARIHALGEMASTLAHELNQPLTAIANYNHGCINQLQSGNYQIDKIIKRLKQTALQAERAGEIIHRLKNFVQKGELYYETVDLNQVVQAAAGLFDYKIRQHAVNIKFVLASALPLIEIDKMQIEQVLLNLLRNAIEAMQEAGIEQPQLTIHTSLDSKQFIAIRVIDNGPGFAEELVGKFWEPYFSTKKDGLGIGLSISRTIVEEHGGKLTACLNPGNGSCFQITLPMQRK